jgi:ankyrin repeat protein
MNSQNYNGDTALHLCANHTSTDIVQIFLDHPDIDINIQNRQGFSPLHLSVIYRSIELTHLLLARSSVRVDLRDNQGRTVWNFVNLEFAKVLDTKTSSLEVLFEAALYHLAQNNNDIVNLLLDSHPLILDMKDKRGANLLHFACEARNEVLFSKLLPSAKANDSDFLGNSYLHTTSRTDNLDFTRQLLANGFDPTARNLYGKMPGELTSNPDMLDLHDGIFCCRLCKLNCRLYAFILRSKHKE